MTKKNSTKKALLLSLLSLIVCVSMLIGTTFAWFTDSVTSGSNIIKSGNLDVEMYWLEGDEDPATPIWNKASAGAIFNNTLWEPGYVEAKHIKIANEGSLAFKYMLQIVPNGTVEILADVIDVYYIEGATKLTRDMLANATPVGTLRDMINEADGAAHGVLLPDGATPSNADEVVGEATATIAFKMRESAGNEYMNKQIGANFSIYLFATQYTFENDSFDKVYDKDSTYTDIAEGDLRDDDLDLKANNVILSIPEEAGNGHYRMVVDNKNTKTNTNNETTVSFDLSLFKDGVAVTENPGVEYDVKVEVGSNLDIAKVLHKGKAVTNYTYDAVSGIISFTTASFSPFEVVYYVVPEGSISKVKTEDGTMQYFTSFADVFAAAKDGSVITLLDDVTLTDTLVFDKDVKATLDLNGKTISGEITTLIKLQDGQLSIKNGSIKNVHAEATDNKYSIYMSGDAKAEIKDVNIETTGVGIYMTENAHITELDANIDSYITVSGYCTFDAVSMLGNAKIDLISDGTYKTYFAESMFEAKLAGKPMGYNQCYTINLNSAGAYIGEISGGTFIGAMDTANNGTPIHVNNGTVELISGGYFGFAEKSFSDAIYMLFANTSNGGAINKITGGTFEKGIKPVNIPRYTGYGCDFENIVAASGCKVELTGETVVRGNQLSSKVKESTLEVVKVVAQ